MSTRPFNPQAWAADVDRRIKKIEEFLVRQYEYQRQTDLKIQGLSGLADDRTTSMMKRGLDVIGQEVTSLKARHGEVLEEQRDFRQIVDSVGSMNKRVEAQVRGVENRLRELAYHVGVYDEVVQGIAIRPERAVPATRINQKTGATEVNPVKVHTKTYWLPTTPQTVTVPANGTASASFIIPPEQNEEGDMEIFYLELASATSTSLRVRLNHTGLGGKFLSNQPVHILSTFGNMNAGPQPFGMYETIFLQPNMELIVEFQDFSGAPNTVEVIAHGRKFIGYATSGMDRRGLIDVFARNTWPYWQTTDQPVTLDSTAGVTVPYSMTLERQFHAELAKVMRFGSIGGVPTPVEYRISMQEGSSGNALIGTNQVASIPINTVAGSGNFPFPCPEPYLALRGTQLTGTMAPIASIAGQVADFVWHGRALPLTFPAQRALEALFDGRSIQLPPASRDINIPIMIAD